ncbi:lysyl-tRNA synthetase class 1 [Sphingomonas kaistensis]|uniref:Lysine--tRNA ligase n=1 Tax=Sphingomonas kaistensis TaxID=298708 RepID=A0A7X5Y3N4_9SPHN|nr:lysine--tRNA ligase [Sphingomonas kaistensis]NJC04573.1 lysyl-tRNA synthetase class 1 [Sphingomonas kaistensis]
MTDDAIRQAALANKTWVFEEARKLLARYPDGKPGGAPIVFETGYGPSGLPHIGTFTEVLRTTWVRRAYETLTGGTVPTRLVAFSDDMDGLRKVPDNVPNGELLQAALGKPLTQVPDPFGCHPSFAHHNNALLRQFLDRFGFDYEFVSATDAYSSGQFDEALRQVLRHFDDIMGVMLPTLREERRLTYSPVLPISPTTGRVLQVPVRVVDAEAGTITFTDEDGSEVTQSALGGLSKLQWKVDWAMRWVALGVDYEMAGKDLIDSTIQSGKIARILGARPPEGFNYEMFLDEKGEKISKSKGNGLTLDDWLKYGGERSLEFYLFREPRKAKNLHLGLIPRAIDDYWQFRGRWPEQPSEQRLGNPVHHIHGGTVPEPAALPLGFGLLLNLASLPGVADKDTAWRFVQRYAPGTSPENDPELDELIGLAVTYARDFVVPGLQRRAPTEAEAAALRDLDAMLGQLAPDTPADDIQNAVFEIGKQHYGKERLREWFQAAYETLLGSSQGPRLGSFIALYGIDNSRRLIAEALAS